MSCGRAGTGAQQPRRRLGWTRQAEIEAFRTSSRVYSLRLADADRLDAERAASPTKRVREAIRRAEPLHCAGAHLRAAIAPAQVQLPTTSGPP
jgi:hypothetical protein